MTTRHHYEALLAEHYTWMFGVPFAQKVAEQRLLLEQLDAIPDQRRLALDLGTGSGFQAVALADIGFSQVIAVDLSPTLLAELDRRKQQRPIKTIEADLNDYVEGCRSGTVDIIVCMGDTLTHLDNRTTVARLFAAAASKLAVGGSFVLTYRDLSTEITGTSRFLPVASDPDRILTCFLEYTPEAVVVHDLLYERAGEQWNFRASAYRKLRLAADVVKAELCAAGFTSVEQRPAGRLTGFVAWKG